MQDYIDKFTELISDADYVENGSGQKLMLEGRTFRQCYDSNDKARSQLPPYWFCDQEGDVVSIANDKMLWIVPENNHGRGVYHYATHEEDGSITRKIIRRASLCGLVWDSYRYGRADEILNTEGVYAFGTNGEKLTVSCHHKDGDKTNDNCDNLEFATNKIHLQTIHKIPVVDDIESQAKFMQRLTEVACGEEPDKITVFAIGDDGYKEIIACDDNQLPDSFKKLINNAAYQTLVCQIIETLVQSNGMEYFTEDRFLYIVPTKQILKVHFENTESRFAVSKPSIAEISNKELIACVFDDKGAAVLLEGED